MKTHRSIKTNSAQFICFIYKHSTFVGRAVQTQRVIVSYNFLQKLLLREFKLRNSLLINIDIQLKYFPWRDTDQ